MGIFEKFKIGFQKSASNLTAGLKEIILKKEIDDHTLNKIEDFLIFEIEGSNSLCNANTVAICIAVGIVSLED